MDKKFDRLRRQQQRLWRKAAVTILSLHHNVAIIMAFLMIAVLGIFWVLVDQKLEEQLLDNARAYGYGISKYAASDLTDLIHSEDKQTQQHYLQRLIRDPHIIEARLFDTRGNLLASSKTDNIAGKKPEHLTLLADINENDKKIGIIQIQIDRRVQDGPIQKLLNNIALFSVSLMILAIILSWLVTKRLTKSLRKLLDFPLNTPEDTAIKNLDIGAELKLLLQSSTETSDSPAPVSRAEEAGIHQLLAADSNANKGDVIILKLYLPGLTAWLQQDNGSKNVKKLRKLDRTLIMTIHSQQGHLLTFDGITAQACFGLDGNLSSAVYRSVSCSLMLEQLLGDLSLVPKISLRKEQRLLIHHMKRTPVAIPTFLFKDDCEFLFASDKPWLMLHNNICEDPRLVEQTELAKVNENWQYVFETSQAAKSMIERQLTWIRYLLPD